MFRNLSNRLITQNIVYFLTNKIVYLFIILEFLAIEIVVSFLSPVTIQIQIFDLFNY